jgi:hypothetical protein
MSEANGKAKPGNFSEFCGTSDNGKYDNQSMFIPSMALYPTIIII